MSRRARRPRHPVAEAWHKLGLVFAADGTRPWLHSHASNPFGVWLGADRLRVFFSARDAEQRSHVASLVLDMARGATVSDLSDAPLLSPGDYGTFDDCGCSMGCALEVDGRLRLYYLGWNLRRPSPWLNAIGCAHEDPATGTFVRVAPAPVLDRSAADPYSLSYPSVLREGGRWRMWYGSNLGWGDGPYDMRYVLKHAWSDDGLRWHADGHVALPLAPGETALARPQVLARAGGGYRMWYSRRGTADAPDYRIGMAESDDGLAWTRHDDEAGIGVSAAGWDSEMVCYPFVFSHRGREYMLYNGNGYGRSGFGLAVRGGPARG